MKKTLWILLDDRRGSVGQAKGIAMALEDRMNIVEKQLVYTATACLPNWIKGRSLMGVDIQKSDKLDAPYPDIVLSTSRRTVATARFLRKKSGNKTKIVQLMYPSGGVGIKDMEMVIVPSHDSLKKQSCPNALVITGAPNCIFADKLSEAARQWNPVFGHLPRPLTAVILGGAIKGKPWPLKNVENLAEQLKDMHEKIGGSFLITSSRRTGKEAEDIIMKKIEGLPMYTYMWGEKKNNPLMGFYACADRIVVTADSVSMCSEACGTGKPVLLFKGQNWLPKKHQRFADSLIAQEYAQNLIANDALTFMPKKTFNPARSIAEKLLEIK